MADKIKDQCTGMCDACPLAFTDKSEMVQNYGCLPEPYDIYALKRKFNRNWHCHEDDNKVCIGFVQWAKEHGIDYKSGEPATYTQWNNNELPERGEYP